MASENQSLDALKINRPVRADTPRSSGWVVAVAVVIIGALAVWWFTRSSAVVVKTASVQVSQSGGATTLLNASGYVTARRQATVSSKVTGRVTEVLIEEGNRVAEGQVLARIDDTNVRTQLELARAQLESAKRATGETAASLDQAKRTLRRTTQLAEKKVTSEAELDAAQAEVSTLEARLEHQRAEVDVAERSLAYYQQQLDDTIVRAPFAGVVTAKNAQPGEMISPMSAGGSFTRTGICTIVDMNSLEVEVDVNESYINRVSAGQPVVSTLDSYPDWPIPSKVIAIIPSADRQKATVKVRVGFEALDPRILPDMGLKVAFQNSDVKQAVSRILTIPKAALRQIDGKDAVWVVRDGKVERRAISVMETRNDSVFVRSGLESGEQVVTEGPETLTEGMRVTEKSS